MRILIVTQYFWPETFRINELTGMLTDHGHTVTVLTGVPNYPTGDVFGEYAADPSSFSVFEGSSVIRVPMVARGTTRLRLVLNYLTFAVSASVLGAWKLRRRHFDVIFVYEPSPITVGIPGAVFRRLKRSPSCLWILDLWPDTPHALGMLPNATLYRFVAWGVRQIYRSTDLLLVQSPGFEASVRSYAPADRRIEYFPSWADAVFDEAPPTPAPEVVADTNVFTIVFAGNIGEAQDFETILAAAAQLAHRSSVRFLILGDGRQSGWLAEQIQQRELGKIVVLLGRHPVERMPEFFAHADAMLVSLRPDPVFSKTIPAKVQAYMASGKPIIALLDGEGAAAVTRWDCGVVAVPGDSASLVEAITKLIESPTEVRKQMGENGRQGAEQEFNRHVLVKRLIGWMNELVDGSPSRRGVSP